MDLLGIDASQLVAGAYADLLAEASAPSKGAASARVD